MKKLFTFAFWYAIAGMAGGVFYREFTKFNSFTAPTALARVHLHLLVLGTFFCLILGILCAVVPLLEQKRFGKFFCVYNIGLVWMTVMLLVRGILQTLAVPLSAGATAAVSGVAGLGHILVGVGIAGLLWAIRGAATAKPSHNGKVI